MYEQRSKIPEAAELKAVDGGKAHRVATGERAVRAVP